QVGYRDGSDGVNGTPADGEIGAGGEGAAHVAIDGSGARGAVGHHDVLRGVFADLAGGPGGGGRSRGEAGGLGEAAGAAAGEHADGVGAAIAAEHDQVQGAGSPGDAGDAGGAESGGGRAGPQAAGGRRVVGQGAVAQTGVHHHAG